MLRKGLEILLRKKRTLSEFLSRFADSRPFQWLAEHRERMASLLYFFWITGCCYWFYQLVVIDVRPRTDWIFISGDTREALVYTIFGAFGFIFAAFVAFFITKFIYNLIHEEINSLFPLQWYSLVKSVSYILALSLAFTYIENIKVAGLTAYTQVAEIVHMSRQHDDIVKENLKGVLNAIRQETLDDNE
jgi:hypothetical protein